MHDNVDRIEPFATAQCARDLFRSRHCAAEKHRERAGPQPGDQRGNVRDSGIDKDDFARGQHQIAPERFDAVLRE